MSLTHTYVWKRRSSAYDAAAVNGASTSPMTMAPTMPTSARRAAIAATEPKPSRSADGTAVTNPPARRPDGDGAVRTGEGTTASSRGRPRRHRVGGRGPVGLADTDDPAATPSHDQRIRTPGGAADCRPARGSDEPDGRRSGTSR